MRVRGVDRVDRGERYADHLAGLVDRDIGHGVGPVRPYERPDLGDRERVGIDLVERRIGVRIDEDRLGAAAAAAAVRTGAHVRARAGARVGGSEIVAIARPGATRGTEQRDHGCLHHRVNDTPRLRPVESYRRVEARRARASSRDRSRSRRARSRRRSACRRHTADIRADCTRRRQGR